MSLTKRYIDELIEKGDICPTCQSAEKHNRKLCANIKAEQEQSEIERYLNR